MFVRTPSVDRFQKELVRTNEQYEQQRSTMKHEHDEHIQVERILPLNTPC
jgi:hypothetical protein